MICSIIKGIFYVGVAAIIVAVVAGITIAASALFSVLGIVISVVFFIFLVAIALKELAEDENKNKEE